MALCALLFAGCSQHACPDYRIADGITVDAGAFVDAHPQAGKLCATGTPCLLLDPAHPRPAVVRLAADQPGPRQVSITITARDGTVLLRADTQVEVRHVVSDPECGQAANLGSVSVAADGSLRNG
ncbi:hypothetical protein ODJ79_42260 [Actinoplanes sp. KI2]|uniref:hypothetical protein n=1 Tax=Actinoplanes sp. KI2 TaxID=2983315 RepID=UPI0021D5E6A4|nr:hypothetical protein [Actinoplanes sp. KI2]MCU7730383.1 hypothetical protein [Actinoplanes sp. KI2]